jgi:hypothetical protein
MKEGGREGGKEGGAGKRREGRSKEIDLGKNPSNV